MTRFKVLLLTLFTLLSFPVFAAASESKWVLFGQEEMFDHYYDEANVLRSPEDVIGVWVKVVPTQEKAKEILLAERRRRAFLMEGYEEYQYTVTALEIDCPKKIRALMESRDYGKKGKILDKVGAVRRNWVPIGPKDHPHAFYHKILCKKVLKP
ncbi:MAG: surface-adhesin E family protein [Nitrospiria bacterium]